MNADRFTWQKGQIVILNRPEDKKNVVKSQETQAEAANKQSHVDKPKESKK